MKTASSLSLTNVTLRVASFNVVSFCRQPRVSRRLASTSLTEISRLTSLTQTASPQVGEPTYAAKLTASDFEIDWSQPPAAIDRLVRVGGAWTTFRGKRLKIVEAELVDGQLVPAVVQPEGKRPMSFVAWHNGARPTPSELFGES